MLEPLSILENFNVDFQTVCLNYEKNLAFR